MLQCSTSILPLLKNSVCRGEITLERAQTEIRGDWIAGYLSHPQLPPVSAPHP